MIKDIKEEDSEDSFSEESSKKKNKTTTTINNEPTIKWADSEAKRLLEQDIREGRVPAKGKDAAGKRTGLLSEIYHQRPEFALYKYKKFSSRLSSLRATINKDENDSSSRESADNADSSKKKKKNGEPKIKWERSKAKHLLYQDIREGRVPAAGLDADGKRTGVLVEIYALRPEFALYKYENFSSRLSSLRATVKDRDTRAALDQEAMDNVVANHEPVLFSKKGYIQWQGSDAQELLKVDLEAGLENAMSRMDLYGSRREYHQNFPLGAFRDKVNQEIRTAKYLHTLDVRGKDTRKIKGRRI